MLKFVRDKEQETITEKMMSKKLSETQPNLVMPTTSQNIQINSIADNTQRLRKNTHRKVTKKIKDTQIIERYVESNTDFNTIRTYDDQFRDDLGMSPDLKEKGLNVRSPHS